MPDLKISQLNNGDPAQTADQIPINRAGVNFSITAGSISSLATANSADTEVLFNNAGVVDGDPQFTFNPTGDILSLTGQFNVDNLRFDGNTLVSTDTDGNVLITPNGTGGVGINGDPSGVVDGGTVLSKFCVKQDESGPVAAFVKANNSAAAPGSTIFACRSRGTLASPTVVQNNDRLVSVIALGFDGTDLASAASIDFEVDGTPGANDMPGRIIFSTTPDGSQTPTEALKIDNAQRSTFAVAPNFNSLTASTALALDASKNVVSVTNTGTGNNVLASGPTVTSPRIVTGINDTNGNELFLFTATASAVNELTYANAATTGAPTFTASGSDTNIGVRVASKGTGQVQEGYASGFWALASEYDVGTDPNDIPLNQYLGTVAFQDATSVAVGQLRANSVAGIGYTLGAGSAVTQATSRTTGVTINAACGSITLVSAAGQNTYQTFTVTNSSVAATDTIIVNQKSGTDLNIILVTAVAAGSFDISFATTGGTTTEQPVFNFAVIKATAS